MLIYNSNKYSERVTKPIIQTLSSERVISKSKFLTPANKAFLKSLGFKLKNKK